MPEKPKVAFYWCASCGGCEEAVVDLAEGILDVVAAVDIVFWPVALDFKRKDVEAMADGSILATFLNGAIRSTEQEEMAHLLRKKSKVLIAFGSCSHLGGIPGLANLFERESILRDGLSRVAEHGEREKTRPQLHYRDNRPCGGTAGLYSDRAHAGSGRGRGLLHSRLPAHAEDLAQRAADSAERAAAAEGHRACSRSRALRRVPAQRHQAGKLGAHRIQAPASSADRRREVPAGAGRDLHGPRHARRLRSRLHPGNMPCTGCCGPTSRVKDQGAKALCSLASLVDSKEEAEIDRVLETIPDPVGTFYRYSLPSSLLRRKKFEGVALQEASK